MRFSFNEVLEYTLHFHWVLQVRRAVTSMAESGITTIIIIIISSSALEPLTPVVRAEVCPAPLETQRVERKPCSLWQGKRSWVERHQLHEGEQTIDCWCCLAHMKIILSIQQITFLGAF